MKLLILGLLLSGQVFAQGLSKENCVTTKLDPVTLEDGSIQNVTTIVCKSKSFTKEELAKLEAKAKKEAEAKAKEAETPKK